MNSFDKAKALAAFDETYAKTVPIGQKLDVVFCKLRMGLYDLDHAILKDNFAKAKELLDAGGDWERRNRLKVRAAALELASMACVGAPQATRLPSGSRAAFAGACRRSALARAAAVAGRTARPRSRPTRARCCARHVPCARRQVYEALSLMSIREFKQAATLLLDSVATFTATEICSYEQFIAYAVLAAQLALDRPTMKAKVVDAPEILAVIGKMPHIESFLNSLYARAAGGRARRVRSAVRSLSGTGSPRHQLLWMRAPQRPPARAPLCRPPRAGTTANITSS